MEATDIVWNKALGLRKNSGQNYFSRWWNRSKVLLGY